VKVVIVHNPAAGNEGHEAELLVRLARQLGCAPTYFSTDDPAWLEAVSDSVELVVAAGGDGTVAHVAKQMAGRRVPLALLPLGTANNIARALGQAADVPLERLVAGWRTAARRTFDLGTARGPWGSIEFLESVGAGLLAETIAAIDASPASLLRAHPDAGLRVAAARGVFCDVLTRLRPTRYEVLVDGVDRSGDYLLVEVLNFGAAGR
jgi:diacylglycerol kinase family enzyme